MATPRLLRTVLSPSARTFASTRCTAARPPLSPLRYSMVSRTLVTATPRSEAQQSTALLDHVKQREEASDAGSKAKAVIESGKGSEGRHERDGLIPVISEDLNDNTRTGPWTISHPIYTEKELETVEVVRRERRNMTDTLAAGLVGIARKSFDFVTGYRHKEIPQELLVAPTSPETLAKLRDGGYILTPDQWLSRILMLESVAGVPGMVGGVLRHLRSLRLMRRDGGWIHTLLSEAENERMHLLTFMTIKQPSIIFRAFVLGIQGVFFNLFFLAYLVSPQAAHRFVGYLEEEACVTYTRCIEDMRRGWVPEWESVKAPGIAIDYWRLPEKAMLLDVIKAVRADEATHRFVNHTLANLDQNLDFNPFALKEADPVTRGTQPGYTREEAAEFAREAHEEQQRLAERIAAPQKA